MSDKNCDLFCFRQCSDKYDTLILKKDMQSVQKLSLKKLSNNLREQQKNRIKKASSYTRLEHYKCSTDRSKDQQSNQKQVRLFRKKIQIEREIEEVNKSIFLLNDQYKMKIKMLQNIKEELDGLIHQNDTR